MRSTAETGHAKIVANFQTLIAFAKGYGTTYNPAKNSLKIPQLEALLAEAKASLTDVLAKNTAYNSKVNERSVAFRDLKTFSTRLLNALHATEASPQLIDDAKGYNRKIQGQRKTTLKPVLEDADARAPKLNSTSHQSYVQMVNHFEGLISVLSSEPTYTPNETDLQIATLQTKKTILENKNEAVETAFTQISNSRNARNATLYDNKESIYEIATEVKKYVKSIYGTKSPEFSQVSGILFKKSKK